MQINKVVSILLAISLKVGIFKKIKMEALKVTKNFKERILFKFKDCDLIFKIYLTKFWFYFLNFIFDPQIAHFVP